MEDILASIRRILNEDEQQPAGTAPAEPVPATAAEPATPPAAAPPPAPPPATVEEPFALTEAMLVAEPPRPATPLAAGEGLLGAATAAAAAASVSELRRAMAQDRGTATHRGGPTIEELVREEVRPLLKAWLDTHLPPLVERLVRAELARVAQGGG